MIYGQLTDAPAYRGIHPRLDRVLALLTPDFLASVGTERQLLEEDDALYVTRFDVPTVTDEARLFEYHRRYLDVFVCVGGCERVDIAQGDYWGCAGEAEQSVLLRPDSFLVLFPGDAHRPGMAPAQPEAVSRVVFKILL